MADTLLFLHLLSAAMVFAAVAIFTALAFGARLELGVVSVSRVLWNAGLVGVLVFGAALAIDIDGYEIWDAWILIAIALWIAVGPIGERVPRAYREAGGGEASIPAGAVRAHWIAVALVVLLLADMIWKPWA